MILLKPNKIKLIETVLTRHYMLTWLVPCNFKQSLFHFHSIAEKGTHSVVVVVVMLVSPGLSFIQKKHTDQP